MNGKIKDAIAQLAGTYLSDEVYMTVCSVTAVDEPTRTCTCTTITGKASTDLQGVQLMAEVDDGMLLLPTVGSTVIVVYSKRNVPYVALFSQIDKVVTITGESSVTQTTDSIVAVNGNSTFTIQNDSIVAVNGSSTLTIENDGYKIKNSSISLTTIMQDLIQAMLDMSFLNGAGTTGGPLNTVQINNVLTEINNILK